MSALESERHALRENLAKTLGPETAGKLMEHIPPVSWDKLATKDDLREVADKLATKDDLREVADKMATKDDLREGFAEMGERLTGHRESILMTMIGHHRMTMLTLVGMAISIIVVLVISSPA